MLVRTLKKTRRMKQKHKKKISNVNLVAMKRSLILLSCVTAVLGCTSEDPKRELCFLSTPVAYANRVIEGSTLRLRTMPEISAAELQWTGPNGFISNEQSPILPNMSSEMAGIYYVKKSRKIAKAYPIVFTSHW